MAGVARAAFACGRHKTLLSGDSLPCARGIAAAAHSSVAATAIRRSSVFTSFTLVRHPVRGRHRAAVASADFYRNSLGVKPTASPLRHAHSAPHHHAPGRRLRVFAAYVAQRIEIARFAKRMQAEWRLAESAIKVDKDWAIIRVPYSDFSGVEAADSDGHHSANDAVEHSYISVSRRGAIVVVNAPPHLRRAATASGTGLFDSVRSHSGSESAHERAESAPAANVVNFSLEPLLRDRSIVSGLMFDTSASISAALQQQQQPITEDLTVVLRPHESASESDSSNSRRSASTYSSDGSSGDSTRRGGAISNLSEGEAPEQYCVIDRRGDLILASHDIEPEAVRILNSVLAQTVNLHHFEGQVERMYEVVGDVFSLLQSSHPDGGPLPSASPPSPSASAGFSSSSSSSRNVASSDAAFRTSSQSPGLTGNNSSGSEGADGDTSTSGPFSQRLAQRLQSSPALANLRQAVEAVGRVVHGLTSPPLAVVRQMYHALGLGAGSRPTDTAQLYRWLGASNAIANAIMLSGLRSISIRPGSTAWNDPRFANMHEILEAEFDLGERYEQLERRLEYVSESLKYALEVAKDNKSLALERLIVWLITAELAISLVSHLA